MWLEFLLEMSLFVLGVALLVYATQQLMVALEGFSLVASVNLFAVAGLFSALATSLPELFVGVRSAMGGDSGMVLGLVLGSNIANVSLVIGAVSVFGKGIGVEKEFVRGDMLKAFGALVAPWLLFMDGVLSRYDGLVLVMVFAGYHMTIFAKNKKYKHKTKVSPWKKMRVWVGTFADGYVRKLILRFVLGVGLLLLAADLVVRQAGEMAVLLSLPSLVVGMFIVALGTSLPELAFELRAVANRNLGVVFGDLLGSLVANSTLIIGLSVLISPAVIPSGSVIYVNSVLFFLLLFLLLWWFMKSKLELSVREGGCLLVIYVVFVVLQVRALGGVVSL